MHQSTPGLIPLAGRVGGCDLFNLSCSTVASTNQPIAAAHLWIGIAVMLLHVLNVSILHVCMHDCMCAHAWCVLIGVQHMCTRMVCTYWSATHVHTHGVYLLEYNTCAHAWCVLIGVQHMCTRMVCIYWSACSAASLVPCSLFYPYSDVLQSHLGMRV